MHSSSFGYKMVGRWFDDGLTIDTNVMLWNERSARTPESVCSFPCSLGEIKIMQQGEHTAAHIDCR